MERDIRETALFREAEDIYYSSRRPNTGLISDASPDISTNGTHVAFAGAMVGSLTGTPVTRICSTDLATGDTRVLTFGPHIDRSPRYSPDGRQIAFLSDRQKVGDFQLYLLDPHAGAARSTPPVPGWAEYLRWSPDGARVLVGVAGHGADLASSQGAIATKQAKSSLPSWIPTVEMGDDDSRWRRLCIYEVATRKVCEVSLREWNVWEAAWCGNDKVAALVSSGPSEGLWYAARVRIIDIRNGASQEIYVPEDQCGCLSASPSGKYLALVDAVCSDRGLVAGDLRLVDTSSGEIDSVGTRAVDVSYTEWRSERVLLVAGHRNLETVVGTYDTERHEYTENWCDSDITTSGAHVMVNGLNDTGDCVLVGEGFTRAPELAVIHSGQYKAIQSFDTGYAAHAETIKTVQRITWKSYDGLEIQGWLLLPKKEPPHPTIMNIHGGPLWHWRPSWLCRGGMPSMLLLKHGYAIFYPNPRGSSGRGRDYAKQILGDAGGADTYDYLTGLDHLVTQGLTDPQRLGVIGSSYGGFMASWLITQDKRFSAAVSVAPVTNYVTTYLMSNIPDFVPLLIGDRYNDPAGKYFQRSPIMHAHRATTPTLHVCGALDRCTPAEEAVQFHRALRYNGVKSVLLTYPEEGHGIRGWPASIDYAARVATWFLQHLPVTSNRPTT